MMDIFVSSKDCDEGKVLKYQRGNPLGEDVHLMPDGTIVRDEDNIIMAQRIFKHNWYKPGGPWDLKTREKYMSGVAQPTNLETKSRNELPVPELPENPEP
jgi:hypothetical protein